MKRQWFLDCYCNQQFASLLEDNKIVEFSSEEVGTGGIVGNIYKGKVVNVLSGLGAVFVSCGLDKNCYLTMDETYADASKYDNKEAPKKKVADLKEGDEILVQVVKPPRGNKGAKVTATLSFVGKYLIYLHGTNLLGISRRITEEAVRERVLSDVEKLRKEKDEEGFIIRTIAPDAAFKTLKKESENLRHLYENMQKKAKTAPVGTLLYQDLDLPVRVVRDALDGDAEIVVGNKDLYDRIVEVVRLRGEAKKRKITLYKGERSMYREYGIFDLIEDCTNSEVPLEGGGNLIIDHAEAMTVIDVNTGSYIGENLQKTVFDVNMRATKEIARQVRLRNVGGIVVVDFVDMADVSEREQVTNQLREELRKDRAKTNVLPMSEFCLTEFTRKRVGYDILSYLVKPCEKCKGKGFLPDDLFAVTKLRADLLDLFAEGYNAVIVDIQKEFMKKILAKSYLSEEVKTRWKDKTVYLIPHHSYGEGEFRLRGDNSGVLSLPNNAQILY